MKPDIYDSIYMDVVRLVEDDNIQGEKYIETANKLKNKYVITLIETPPVEDGKQGWEIDLKEFSRCINALALELPAPVWDDVYNRWLKLKSSIIKSKSLPSTPVQPGERINKVKDAIGFLLSCAYPEMIASEYNRNKEVLTEICKLIDTIATSTPVQDGWEEEKPNKECVFVSATKYERNDEDLLWDYTVWQIKKLDGEDDNGNPAWYFGLLNGDGEEWGPLEDLSAHLYKIIPSPPVNKQD